MFSSILERLGLGVRKKSVTTVRLEIIAEQVKEFNETKRQLNDKINVLETKTTELDETVSKTLDLTRDNQSRLENIEKNLERIIVMSEATVLGKAVPTSKPAGGAPDEKGDKPS